MLQVMMQALLVYGVLESVHVGLTAVQRSPGDIYAHGVDAHVVWGESERKYELF